MLQFDEDLRSGEWHSAMGGFMGEVIVELGFEEWCGDSQIDKKEKSVFLVKWMEYGKDRVKWI